MDDRVVAQILDRPLSETLQDSFVNTQIKRIIFPGKFIRVIISLSNLSSIFTILITHLFIRSRVVSFKCVLRLSREKAPTRVEVDVCVKLSLPFMLLEVGSMDADYISNLTNQWAVLKSSCVDNHCGNFEVIIPLVAKSVI